VHVSKLVTYCPALQVAPLWAVATHSSIQLYKYHSHHYLHNKCATKHHLISLRELFDYNRNCEFGRLESMPNACFCQYNDKLLDMFPFVVCSLVLVKYTACSIVRVCSTPYVCSKKTSVCEINRYVMRHFKLPSALPGRRHSLCCTQYTFLRPTACLACRNDKLLGAYVSSTRV